MGSIECVQGDIARQTEIDAVVNAANAQLRSGGGVAGALHRAAGPGLAEECQPLAPIRPGQAVITGAHNLPNDHVIHVLGPVYGRDNPSDRLLADCYNNALDVAEENGVESIGFPAISTGAFGYPTDEAAEIALDTVVAKAKELSRVKLIRFVLFERKSLEVHEARLDHKVPE